MASPISVPPMSIVSPILVSINSRNLLRNFGAPIVVENGVSIVFSLMSLTPNNYKLLGFGVKILAERKWIITS